MMVITLGLCVLVSAVLVLRRHTTTRHLAPRPVVIRTTPRRRR